VIAATAPNLTYTISGKITNNGTGLPRIGGRFRNSSGIVVTDAGGNYTFTVYAPVITHHSSINRYTFLPVSRTADVTTANIPQWIFQR